MKVYLEGEIRGVVKRESTDSESGLQKTKYRTFIENEDGERLEINCATDYSAHKGKSGVARINVWDRDGGGYWLTLDQFTPSSVD